MTANIPEIESATAIGAATFSIDTTSISSANLWGIGDSKDRKLIKLSIRYYS
jgi:hypothetical protein